MIVLLVCVQHSEEFGVSPAPCSCFSERASEVCANIFEQKSLCALLCKMDRLYNLLHLSTIKLPS